MPETIGATCPYCGEPIELVVDASAGSSNYIEDCQVCCRPIRVDVEIYGEGGISVELRTGDE
jgi:hypothetical protein